MLSEEFYNKIVGLCDSVSINKSSKNAKWILYRLIKNMGTDYQAKAEAQRLELHSSDAIDDEIKIYMLCSVIKKDKFTDEMSYEEFRQHVLRYAKAVVEA